MLRVCMLYAVCACAWGWLKGKKWKLWDFVSGHIERQQKSNNLIMCIAHTHTLPNNYYHHYCAVKFSVPLCRRHSIRRLLRLQFFRMHMLRADIVRSHNTESYWGQKKRRHKKFSAPIFVLPLLFSGSGLAPVHVYFMWKGAATKGLYLYFFFV